MKRVSDKSIVSDLYHLNGWLMIGLVLQLTFGCSARPKPTAPEPTSINMSTLLIRPNQTILNSEDLFEEGVGAFQGQKFELCEERLKTYLKYFSEDLYAYSAHYNLGLCFEFQRKHKEAAKQFRAFRDLSKTDQDRLDGSVRLGFNLIFSSQVEEAENLYTHLLTNYPLKGFDRAECHLRRAMAHLSQKRYAEADRDLSAAMSHINGSIGPHYKGNEALAEVHFQRGEVYRQHMGEIGLKMPLSSIKRGVADKTRFFRKSLYAYIGAIKVNHTYWAIAAGHQLGVLHEDIYEDLLQAEYPADFDEETLAYYFFELDKKLAPLISESILIYEKTITISATQGAKNDWVQSTEKSLVRLRNLEAELQKRLSLDPLEAYKRKIQIPFHRDPVTVPLPPTPTDLGLSHESGQNTNELSSNNGYNRNR